MKILTAPLICREFVRHFVLIYGEAGTPLAPGFHKIAENRQQRYVDFRLGENFSELNRSLEDFSERLIKPAASALSNGIPLRASFFEMELPKAVRGASCENFRGVAVRFVIDEAFMPIAFNDDWESTEYEQVCIARFDVLYESRPVATARARGP